MNVVQNNQSNRETPDSLEDFVNGSTDPLVVVDHGAIRLIIMNNPQQRNALTEEIRRGIVRELSVVSTSHSVRAVILTGYGGAFSSGFDLSEIKRPGGPAIVRPDPGTAIRDVGVPVIAAVDGVCITGGLELALNASFILASDRARFADTHATLGIMPVWGMSALLPRTVGVRRARQLSLTGEIIDAATALRWGLVNEVMDSSSLIPRAISLAEMIAAEPVGLKRVQLNLFNDMDGHPFQAALAAEKAALTGQKSEKT